MHCTVSLGCQSASETVSNHTLAREHRKVAPAPCVLVPFVHKTRSQHSSPSSALAQTLAKRLRDRAGGGGLVFKKNLDLAPGLVQYIDKYLGPAQGRGQEQRVARLLPTAAWMHPILNQS